MGHCGCWGSRWCSRNSYSSSTTTVPVSQLNDFEVESSDGRGVAEPLHRVTGVDKGAPRAVRKPHRCSPGRRRDHLHEIVGRSLDGLSGTRDRRTRRAPHPDPASVLAEYLTSTCQLVAPPHLRKSIAIGRARFGRPALRSRSRCRWRRANWLDLPAPCPPAHRRSAAAHSPRTPGGPRCERCRSGWVRKDRATAG